VHAPAAIAMSTSTRTYERDPRVDRYIDRLTARTVPFRRAESINVSALTRMLRHIVANNHAGGWRMLKARHS